MIYKNKLIYSALIISTATMCTSAFSAPSTVKVSFPACTALSPETNFVATELLADYLPETNTITDPPQTNILQYYKVAGFTCGGNIDVEYTEPLPYVVGDGTEVITTTNNPKWVTGGNQVMLSMPSTSYPLGELKKVAGPEISLANAETLANITTFANYTVDASLLPDLAAVSVIRSYTFTVSQ